MLQPSTQRDLADTIDAVIRAVEICYGTREVEDGPYFPDPTTGISARNSFMRVMFQKECVSKVARSSSVGRVSTPEKLAK